MKNKKQKAQKLEAGSKGQEAVVRGFLSAVLVQAGSLANKQKAGLPHILSITLIIIISIAIYSNTLKNGFVYDDEVTIVNNTLIKDFGNISKLFKAKEYFTTSGEMSYRPVVTFTYFIDYAIYGLKPWGYHLTNILLHAVNGLLLYIFLTLLVPHSSSLIPLFSPSLIISLLFATHPVLTEAVNAISFREDLLCFMFFISALILYLKNKMSAFCLLSSVFLYLLALLSKEMAITFPLIIILYEWIYGGKEQRPLTSPLPSGERDRVRGLVPLNKEPALSEVKGRLRGLLFNPYIIGYIAVTCFYLFIRFYLFQNPAEDIQAWSLSERLMTIPYFISKYLLLLIAPVSLSADYVITPTQSLISLNFIIPFIAIIFIIILSLILNLKSSIFNLQFIFGILFFLLTLLPVYNIVPIVNPFAERYLYLPTAGFAIILGVGIHRIFTIKTASPFRGEGGACPERSRSGEGWFFKRQNLYILVVSVVILSIYSFAVIQRNKVWLDDYSLWSDTVKKSPSGFKPHNNLGNIYLNQGRINEAIEEFQIALRLNPNYVEVHGSLGNAYLNQGRINEAIEEFQIALRLNPNDVKAHNNLGIVYEKQGHLNEAIKEYKLALTLNPSYAEAHGNLGNVYLNQGRINEAIAEYLAALKINPDMVDAYKNLGNAYVDQGRLSEAIEQFQTALRLNPDDAEIHNDIGVAYANQGRINEAIEEFQTALRLNPNYVEAHNNLSIAIYKRDQAINKK